MGKVEEAVRSTTMRTVRRELKTTLAPLRKELSEIRRSVARLDAAVLSLKEAVSTGGINTKVAHIKVDDISDSEVRRARISPDLIKKLRARLGITQAQLAAILSITGPAVAQWESGTSEPRGENRAALIALRKLGRREVDQLLASRGMRRSQKPNRTAKKAK